VTAMPKIHFAVVWFQPPRPCRPMYVVNLKKVVPYVHSFSGDGSNQSKVINQF